MQAATASTAALRSGPLAPLGALYDARASLLRAGAEGPPDLRDLPVALRDAVSVDDGAFITSAYPPGASMDALQLQKSRLRAEAVHPDAAGLGAVFEVAILGPAKWGARTCLLILAFVLTILALDLRDFRWMVLALAPVLVGGLITFGLLCLLDVGFTVLLAVVVPLLVGLGVDDGIHVVHRMLESPDLSPNVAAESVGRAIVMTTMTTCASFFVLLFSNHPGMESMALAMLFGLPLCMLGSITLIPALAVLLGLRPAPGAS